MNPASPPPLRARPSPDGDAAIPHHGTPATIAACATATGGHSAVLRVSGPNAQAIAQRAGLRVVGSWQITTQDWPLSNGTCPCHVLFAPAPRSFTGHDLIEVTLPGGRDLIALALAALIAAGAEAAAAGGFARQALATGRLTLDRAEAILALAQAPDAAAARLAVERLRGALAAELEPARERLLYARALVEAGLDFLDEADVRAYDPAWLHCEVTDLRAVLTRWRVAADALEGVPQICLVGPANAGKSALFNRLASDGAHALVSPLPGTTRDWLESAWDIGGRHVRLVDTAGWLGAGGQALDAAGVAASERAVAGAALILACSAPDARLPDITDRLPTERTLVIATKADLGAVDARAVLAVSATTGAGLIQLSGLVAARLGHLAGGEPRQQRLLTEADAALARLHAGKISDELIADDLRRAGDALGDLLGVTTTDDVLAAIFGRFCIGK